LDVNGVLKVSDFGLSTYSQLGRAEFTCPPWFSPEAKKLLKSILNPNPLTVSLKSKAFLLLKNMLLLAYAFIA
jgi:hypothetical protein